MSRLKTALVALTVCALPLTPGAAQEDLSDLEMVHVAVTASEIDVAYAHLALALSSDSDVRTFAETMLRDHTAVNGQVAELAGKLGVTPRDNALSRQLLADAEKTKDRLGSLRGEAFDRAYAENELNYHRSVNGMVESAFVPNVENAEIRTAFRRALGVFRGHERHAEWLVSTVDGVGR